MAFNSVTNEVNYVYAQALDKFQYINNRIAEAKREIESFFNLRKKTFRENYGDQKINYKDWSVALGNMKIHATALDKYTGCIKQELEMFENLMNSEVENMRSNISVRNNILEAAKKVVETFQTVETKVEIRIYDIQEIKDQLRNTESMDES